MPVTKRAEAMMEVLTEWVKGIRNDMRENRTADAAITGIPTARESFTFGPLPDQARCATSTYVRQVMPV